MVQLGYNDEQTISANQPAILNTIIGCNRGYVLHRNGSGTVTLSGRTYAPCQPTAKYFVRFEANIAVPEGGTAGPIAVALAIAGEPLPDSKAIVTPAAAEDYWHVSCMSVIPVSKICCSEISLENVSESATPATTPPPQIVMQNANMVIQKIT